MNIEKQFFAVEQMPRIGHENMRFISKTEFDISLKTNHGGKGLREHKSELKTYFIFGDVLVAIWDNGADVGVIFK